MVKKNAWKESQKVRPRVKDGISANAFLKPKEATKTSKQAFKQKKLNYKLQRKKFNKLKAKDGINVVAAKKHMLEAKTEAKVAKKVFKNAKKNDNTRIVNKTKIEMKTSTKNDLRKKLVESMREDDILREGVDSYRKARQYKEGLKRSLQVSKNTGRVTYKAAKGTYGLGNRLFNFSRGRGFYRTPEDLTAKKQLMRKARNFKNRLRAAKEAKKAEQGVNLVQSFFRGQQSLKKVAAIIAKNPITWVILGVLVVVFMISGVAVSSQKPAVVQDDFDLTESWIYMTKLDADHSDTSNVFYTPLDDVMFYMNGVFDDYKLGNMMMSGTSTYSTYLSDLWKSLNGTPPDYELTTMNKLATDKKSNYYVNPEIYEHMQEVRKELGYSTLDNQLSNPFTTDSLIVTRRFGYERFGEDIQMKHGIEVSLTENQELNSPMKGEVAQVTNPNALTIVQKDEVKLTLTGIDSNRFKGGETVTEGSYIGNATKDSLNIKYEKYDLAQKKWKEVNPAFYFKNVTYTQFTSVGSDNFDPGGDIAKRAKIVNDELSKVGGTREGIAAVLGSFAIESQINPKRAEGDYLAPPIGASANSWDDPKWLAMGGMDIYGKFPNILHRGLGLGQWTDTSDGGRRHTLLLEFAKSKNKKWYDLKLQIDFMLNGDTPGNRTAFLNTITGKGGATIPELTNYFLTYWEGNPGDKLPERIQEAQNWYNYFSSNAGDMNSSSKEVFEKYKDKMKPLPTNKEMKDGWPGNSYALGNCTWYVFNRMHQLGKSINPVMGNANQWVSNYIMTPGAKLVDTPRRGDIVIFTNGAANSSPMFGHVAVVEYVNSDGSFVISEMNIQGVYTMGWRVLQKQPGEFFMRVS